MLLLLYFFLSLVFWSCICFICCFSLWYRLTPNTAEHWSSNCFLFLFIFFYYSIFFENLIPNDFLPYLVEIPGLIFNISLSMLFLQLYLPPKVFFHMVYVVLNKSFFKHLLSTSIYPNPASFLSRWLAIYVGYCAAFHTITES